MKKIFLFLSLLPALLLAQSQYDLQQPFGFATRSSRTNASSTYNLTGGGCYTYPVAGVAESDVIVLTSTGSNMRTAIMNAIEDYKVIVFDGSEGEFVVSETMSFSGLSGKTILGINDARICTQWYVTEDDKAALNAANVLSASSSSGTGGILSNGKSVSEEREFLTRTVLIGRYGENESYIKAGLFKFNNCENIIIRNLILVGPGPVDVGGNDLISFTGSKHIWVDHCEFTDGLDGNFDITNSSDFNTVSWCKFSYTSRAYDHKNSNLIGSSDSDGAGKLNTTFFANNWASGCNQRMPMARSGKIHMLSNYYTCSGNSASINPRKNSEFLISNNYFAQGVRNVFSESEATAFVWESNNIVADSRAQGQIPNNRGTVTVPYTMTAIPAVDVPDEVGRYVGATLFGADLPPVSPTKTLCIDLGSYPMLSSQWNCAVLTVDTTKSKDGWNKPSPGFNMNSNSNHVTLDMGNCTDYYISEVAFDITIPGLVAGTKDKFLYVLGEDTTHVTVPSKSLQHYDITVQDTVTRYFSIKREAGTRTVVDNLCFTLRKVVTDDDPQGPETQNLTGTKRICDTKICMKGEEIFIERAGVRYNLNGQIVR